MPDSLRTPPASVIGLSQGKAVTVTKNTRWEVGSDVFEENGITQLEPNLLLLVLSA